MERRDLLKSPLGLLSLAIPTVTVAAVAQPVAQSMVSRKFIERAIRCHGFLIEDIENPDEELQLIAVGQDGLAIQYIKNPSERVCIAAIRQNSYALCQIENPNKKVIWEALRKNAGVYKYIDKPTEDMQLYAASKGVLKAYLDNPSKRLAFALLSYDGRHIGSIEDQTEDLQMVAIKNHAVSICKCKNPSMAVQMEAVKNWGNALRYCPDREDLDLRMAAITQSPYAICRIAKPTDAEWECVRQANSEFYAKANYDYRHYPMLWLEGTL